MTSNIPIRTINTNSIKHTNKNISQIVSNTTRRAILTNNFFMDTLHMFSQLEIPLHPSYCVIILIVTSSTRQIVGLGRYLCQGILGLYNKLRLSLSRPSSVQRSVWSSDELYDASPNILSYELTINKHHVNGQFCVKFEQALSNNQLSMNSFCNSFICTLLWLFIYRRIE